MEKPNFKIKLWLICLSGFLSLIIIFLIGYYLGVTSIKQSSAEYNDFKIGYNTAINDLKSSDQIIIPQNIYTLSGVIKKINNNNFIIEIDTKNPLFKYTPQERNIYTLSTTIFKKLIKKSEEKYNQELIAYSNIITNLPTGSELPPTPERYEASSANYDDLKIGQQIEISSENELLYSDSISAEKINIFNEN